MEHLGDVILDDIDVEQFVPEWGRETARAVVFDDVDTMALLHIESSDFHVLPGGGIEPGEDRLSALRREVREEAGVEIESVQEIGFVVEYVQRGNGKHTAYFYTARVAGEKGEPRFTEGEIASGHQLLWKTLEEATKLIQNDNPEDYFQQFISKRELMPLLKLGESKKKL